MCVCHRLWTPASRYHPDICLEKQWKTIRHVSQNIQWLELGKTRSEYNKSQDYLCSGVNQEVDGVRNGMVEINWAQNSATQYSYCYKLYFNCYNNLKVYRLCQAITRLLVICKF